MWQGTRSLGYRSTSSSGRPGPRLSQRTDSLELAGYRIESNRRTNCYRIASAYSRQKRLCYCTQLLPLLLLPLRRRQNQRNLEGSFTSVCSEQIVVYFWKDADFPSIVAGFGHGSRNACRMQDARRADTTRGNGLLLFWSRNENLCILK